MRSTKLRVALAACALSVFAVSCSSSVNNNASQSSQSSESSSGESESGSDTGDSSGGGSCPENDDRIAELQSELADNLYGIAAAESDAEEVTNPNPIGEGDEITIAFSIEGLSHPFLVAQKEAAEAAAAEAGVQVNVISANDDVNKQFTDIQTAISQNVSAVMMMPAQTQGLDAVLAQADSQSIPYFFTQKGMLGVSPVSQVLAPYVNEGQQLGQFVAEYYADQSDVNVLLVSGIAGDASSVARTGAFEIELLKACNFTILAEQPGQYRREESAAAAENMLTANADVDLIFGANDEAALGAISALETSGRQEVAVVGIDGQADMFEAIENGKALATVVHKPTAGIVVEEIVAYLRGEPVPTFKVLDEDLVTKEAIESGSVEPAF